MKQLIKKVSNHPLTNQRRGIKLKSIQYIDFDLQEAKIVWEEMVLDDGDKPILSNLIPTRTIITDLSNANKVDAQGITITREYVIGKTTQIADESEEEYSERLEKLLQKELEQGYPEFDFYVENILDIEKISEAVTLLDSLKRFDRE